MSDTLDRTATHGRVLPARKRAARCCATAGDLEGGGVMWWWRGGSIMLCCSPRFTPTTFDPLRNRPNPPPFLSFFLSSLPLISSPRLIPTWGGGGKKNLPNGTVGPPPHRLARAGGARAGSSTGGAVWTSTVELSRLRLLTGPHGTGPAGTVKPDVVGPRGSGLNFQNKTDPRSL